VEGLVTIAAANIDRVDRPDLGLGREVAVAAQDVADILKSLEQFPNARGAEVGAGEVPLYSAGGGEKFSERNVMHRRDDAWRMGRRDQLRLHPGK
jgi:hypothetical protein